MQLKAEQMDSIEYGLIDRSPGRDGEQTEHRMSIEVVDNGDLQKKSSQQRFKTPRPEDSPTGTKEYLKAIGVPNISKENSVMTAERGSNGIDSQRTKSGQPQNQNPILLSQPGKQDNSGFSFYRLDDSLYLHGPQGNIAASRESSAKNGQNQKARGQT